MDENFEEICASGFWGKKIFMTMKDEEQFLNVKPTNLENKIQNGKIKM